MDNDNKIEAKGISVNSQRHQEVLLFLNEELKSIQESENVKPYNLEEEYSKTRKNKSWFALIMLLICCLIIVVLSVGMNHLIVAQNRKITIDLNEFDDLNLKGLLDNVSKAQSNYEQAFKTKLTLEASLEAGLKDADTQMENDIYLLDSLKIKNKKDYNNRRAEIITKHTLRQKELHEIYDEKIIVAEKELATYKEELDKFDSVKIESAKAQEKAVNSERQLRELEQKELREEYEAQIKDLNAQIESMRSKSSLDMHTYVNELIEKYEAELAALDPVLRDSKATDIITYTKADSENGENPETLDSNESTVLENPEFSQSGESVETIEKIEKFESVKEISNEEKPSETGSENTKHVNLRRNKFDANKFDANKFIEENGINSEKMISVLTEYQAFYDDYNYLDSAILDLPHKNSIPEYVTASRVLVNEMGEAFAESAADMYRENKELGKQITVLKDDVKKQKKLLEEEKKIRKTDAEMYEEKILQTQEFYESTLENTMIQAKTNAVIISAESADNIKVFVASKVRDSVTSQGVPAEIKIGKLVLKGNLVRVEEAEMENKNEIENFRFVPALNKDGTPVDFDISLLTSGTAIKTALK